MDVESLAKQLILKNMTPEQQTAVLESIRDSVKQSKEVQKQRIGQNVAVVVEALKKIEADIRARYDEVGNAIEQRVANIKDGKDGIDGRDGARGLDGRPGRDGAQGPAGAPGKDGLNGRDGVDGVSVTDAKIDFDGSLIISLSNGREINVGEVVAPDVAEKIRVVANGGGTSQAVIDALASLQTQINGLGTMSTQNANSVAITGGTESGVTHTGDSIANYLNFTPTSAPSFAEGRVWYDSTEKALAFYNDSSALAVHVGQDLIVKVINNTGSTIANGAPVYITGTSSGQTYPNVALARADVAATSSVIGLTNGAIANGSIGYVTAQGIIDNVNTGTFTVGQVLYLSPYSAGQLMNTIPPTGITVQVGVVTFVNSSTGHIYVKQTTPLNVPASIISGAVAAANGGTGFQTYAAGDLIYASATNTLSKLAAGTNGYVLTLASGVPTWAAGGGGSSLTIADDTTTNSSLYPLFTTATSGTVTTEYVSSTKYTYNPLLGTLSAPQVNASNGLVVSNNTVSANYSIPSGSSAMSVGPIAVANGISVTVPNGSRWVVV